MNVSIISHYLARVGVFRNSIGSHSHSDPSRPHCEEPPRRALLPHGEHAFTVCMSHSRQIK